MKEPIKNLNYSVPSINWKTDAAMEMMSLFLDFIEKEANKRGIVFKRVNTDENYVSFSLNGMGISVAWDNWNKTKESPILYILNPVWKYGIKDKKQIIGKYDMKSTNIYELYLGVFDGIVVDKR